MMLAQDHSEIKLKMKKFVKEKYKEQCNLKINHLLYITWTPVKYNGLQKYLKVRL